MPAATSALRPPRPLPPAALPARRRWTVEEFHVLREDGWFDDCKALLIDGEIVEMPIPGPRHNGALTLADYALKAAFGAGHVVRVQLPLVLGQTTDPLPDLAVVAGSPRDFLSRHPAAADLVVEVSESSLAFDTGEKAGLYAAAGIADYWVIDLPNDRLLVHREPVADAAAPHGGRYRKVTTVARGDRLVPIAMPSAEIAAADLLP